MKILITALLFTFAVVQSSTQGAELQVGEQAPNFEVTNQEGKTVDLKSYLGDRHLVVVFSRAHWCPYCMKHLRTLQESYEEIQAAGGDILVVFREEKDGTEGLQKSKKQSKATFPLTLDYNNQTTADFSPEGYGAYVLDSEGKIVEIISGTKAKRPNVKQILSALK